MVHPQASQTLTLTPSASCHTFAAVYGEVVDNAVLFEAEGAPLLLGALDGFNATLAAYGQTGSGKTFTIGEGGGPDEGLSHRMCRRLFDHVTRDRMHSYSIGMQCIQVYKERVYDCLVLPPPERASPVRVGGFTVGGEQAREPESLPLREDKGKGVHVPGARTVLVTSADEALETLRLAASRLIYASTQMNRHSSRSHSLTTLTIERRRVTRAVELPPRPPVVLEPPWLGSAHARSSSSGARDLSSSGGHSHDESDSLDTRIGDADGEPRSARDHEGGSSRRLSVGMAERRASWRRDSVRHLEGIISALSVGRTTRGALYSYTRRPLPFTVALAPVHSGPCSRSQWP